MNDVVFKKIEFVLNKTILVSVEHTTLPAAIKIANQFNPIQNIKMSIVCYYY
jgi:hypothetical protein